LLQNAYLASCNAHKAIHDVIKDSGIIRCYDIDHIHTIRLQSFLALLNGRHKNREFKEGFPHTWPLGTYTSKHKPDWPLASGIVLKINNE
jgi:hypothetical protein